MKVQLSIVEKHMRKSTVRRTAATLHKLVTQLDISDEAAELVYVRDLLLESHKNYDKKLRKFYLDKYEAERQARLQ